MADDDLESPTGGSRRARWRGLVSVAAVRLWKRATGTRSRRVASAIGAVALTIALLVVVTGIALGLADGAAVDENDADVRVTPAEGESVTAVDGVEEPRLGETNARARRIRQRDGIDHASPVLTEPVALEAAGGGEGADGAKRILLVGVVPDEEPRTVSGLSTAALEPGDPHYANGSYDGPRRGQIVLSEAAAERLGVEAGDEVAPGGAQVPDGVSVPSSTVAAVESAGGRKGQQGPAVGLVHLSELQTLAGANDGELAEQVLVWGEEDAATAAATEEYPEATVETVGPTDPSSLFEDELAFATSLLALLVGVAICASFVATTMGMTVNEDRRTLAVLESVGFTTRSRLAIVAVSTLLTTLCGALVGAVLGIGGIYAVNWIAAATGAPGAVAAVHPLFVPYAVAVALIAGVVAVPYPLVVAARTSVLSEVGR